MDGWEDRLVREAVAALADRHHHAHAPAEPRAMAAAYEQCRQVTAANSRTFYLASALLPPPQRRAVRALYAFCRRTDDLVDRPGPLARHDLERWRDLALAGDPTGDEPVALAWAHVRAEYGIPNAYAERLIAGARQDLSKTRYATFDELAEYCYAVASTVGLMTMHIIGFSGPDAVPYAIRLGIALQLTNILRDVAEDWDRGRLYLPLDELDRFEVGEAGIAGAIVDDHWRRLVKFQIDRARRLYAASWPGIALLNRRGRFAVGAAAQLYAAILQDIEAHDCDVFRRRAHLSRWAKLRRLPGIWLRVRQLDADRAGAAG
jgi:phytoene synthase